MLNSTSKNVTDRWLNHNVISSTHLHLGLINHIELFIPWTQLPRGGVTTAGGGRAEKWQRPVRQQRRRGGRYAENRRAEDRTSREVPQAEDQELAADESESYLVYHRRKPPNSKLEINYQHEVSKGSNGKRQCPHDVVEGGVQREARDLSGARWERGRWQRHLFGSLIGEYRPCELESQMNEIVKYIHIMRSLSCSPLLASQFRSSSRCCPQRSPVRLLDQMGIPRRLLPRRHHR